MIGRMVSEVLVLGADGWGGIWLVASSLASSLGVITDVLM